MKESVNNSMRKISEKGAPPGAPRLAVQLVRKGVVSTFKSIREQEGFSFNVNLKLVTRGSDSYAVKEMTATEFCIVLPRNRCGLRIEASTNAIPDSSKDFIFFQVGDHVNHFTPAISKMFDDYIASDPRNQEFMAMFDL